MTDPIQQTSREKLEAFRFERSNPDARVAQAVKLAALAICDSLDRAAKAIEDARPAP